MSCIINRIWIVMVAAVACAVAPQLDADIINVPGDYPTIQEAIDAAVEGDEVIVAAGTYVELIDFLGKAITLRSADGPTVTTIDGNLAGTVVICRSGEGPDTILVGFTITRGAAPSGAGMRIVDSSPTVENCTFRQNEALGDNARGAGVFARGGAAAFTACIFTLNEADGRGGGMFNLESDLAVKECSFTDNLAYAGGAVFNEASSSTFTECAFVGNVVAANGGAIFSQAGSPTIIDCILANNSCTTDGGGMHNSECSATVINCTFADNVSGQHGAGMYNWGLKGSAPNIINCTFTGNVAQSAAAGTRARGGGMANVGLITPTVVNCLFAANTAEEHGGAIENSLSAAARIINCTFIGNTSGLEGGGLHIVNEAAPIVRNCILWGNIPDPFGGPVAPNVRFCDIQGGFPGNGNIDADPLFVDPDNGDYHLSPGSPCIDAADNKAVPKGIDTDLDGNPRFVDDPNTRDTGNGDPPVVDMGAYEFQVASPCTWDLNDDDAVGTGDLILLLGSWGDPYGTADLIELLGNWGPCPK